MIPPQPELLTVDELARWLRVTPRAVYRYIHRYQLPHLRVGRALRFTRADVEAWMRRRGRGEPDVTT